MWGQGQGDRLLCLQRKERVKGEFTHSMNRDIVSKMYHGEDAVVIGVG